MGAQTKLEAGVQLSHHMFSYGERPNDYDSVSKCAWPPPTNFFFLIFTYLFIHARPRLCGADLRNKFGVLHQQSSPNQDRELFSEPTRPLSRLRA